jgi:hypothetical protein
MRLTDGFQHERRHRAPRQGRRDGESNKDRTATPVETEECGVHQQHQREIDVEQNGRREHDPV